MKINSQLKTLFEDSELEKLRKAIVGDNIILPTLDKLLGDKISELMSPTGPSKITTQWPLEKAYREGGAYYLQYIRDIFKEN